MRFSCARGTVGQSGRMPNVRVAIELKQPSERPTMRWMFQCFEGISLVGITPPNGPPLWDIAGLEPLHEQVVALLGPSCEKLYKVDE
jgi:hypothetical protein